jgi:hypothetical protein
MTNGALGAGDSMRRGSGALGGWERRGPRLVGATGAPTKGSWPKSSDLAGAITSGSHLLRPRFGLCVAASIETRRDFGPVSPPGGWPGQEGEHVQRKKADRRSALPRSSLRALVGVADRMRWSGDCDRGRSRSQGFARRFIGAKTKLSASARSGDGAAR